MNPRIPHTIPARWPTVAAGRFAATIRTDSPEGCVVALVGLPDDTGVKLNGGRIGAREGPTAFRAALATYGVAWDGLRDRATDVKVFDAGDVEPALDGADAASDEATLFETHRRVEEALSGVHAMGLIPVCIGGGHDLTLPTVRALAKHVGGGGGGGAVGGVNFDAHLDVRTRVGSGMAFRRLIEDRHLDGRRFTQYGLGRFANDADDLTWLRGQGTRLMFADEILSMQRSLIHGPSSEAAGLWDVVGANAPSAAAPCAAGPDDRGAINPTPASQRSNIALEARSHQERTLFLSLDLDAIDSSQAPGVSASNPSGLSVHHAAQLAESAGREPRVRHFDIMELCPSHDVAGRTARVAAYLFMSFLAGFAERGMSERGPAQ